MENDLKTIVLTHYGNGKLECVKCGFSDIRALCLDHIDGDNKLNVAKRAGGALYRLLKNSNFPNGYQTLCFNCNFIKATENKERKFNPEVYEQQKITRMLKEKSIYKEQMTPEVINEYAGMDFFARYINSLSWYHFDLRDIYRKLKLNDTKKILLRATCLKLIRQGKLKRVGKGKYERLVMGINI